MLAESKLPCYLAIAEADGDQGNHLLLARRKQLEPAGIDHPQRRYLVYDFNEVLQLLTVGPNLPLVNAGGW